MTDTITAIATPEGHGAVSIIRVSGPKSFDSVFHLFVPNQPSKARIKPWRVTSGYVKHPQSGTFIDEVLIVFFKGPRSYTGEDVVEISCHGNPLITHAILDAILCMDVRPAEPGEFTRRAFENGRIDLSKAEAVAMIMASESDSARRAAFTMLRGGLNDPIQRIRKSVSDMRMAFELDLDFPEEDVSVPEADIRQSFGEAERVLVNLIDAGSRGEQMQRGHSIVITGKVNAGKSSLFNQLIGRDKAIVSEEPGTTRDSLDIHFNWNGCQLTLIDTAGIRQSQSIAETEAVRRTTSLLESADLVIYVVDGLNPDLELLSSISHYTVHTPILVFWNKTDIVNPTKTDIETVKSFNYVVGCLEGSALSGTGIRELGNEITSLMQAHKDDSSQPYLMMTLRQQNILKKSLDLLKEAQALFDSGVDFECIIPVLKVLDNNLGAILGDTVSPDILKKIFSGFCIGK